MSHKLGAVHSVIPETTMRGVPQADGMPRVAVIGRRITHHGTGFVLRTATAAGNKALTTIQAYLTISGTIPRVARCSDTSLKAHVDDDPGSENRPLRHHRDKAKDRPLLRMFKWVVVATVLCGVTAFAVAPYSTREEWQISDGHDALSGNDTVDLVQKSSDPIYGDDLPELNIHCEKDHNRVTVGGGNLALGSDDNVVVLWRGEHGGGGATTAVRTGNTAVFHRTEATKLMRDMLRGRSITFRLMGHTANYDMQFRVEGLEALLMKQAPACKPMLS